MDEELDRLKSTDVNGMPCVLLSRLAKRLKVAETLVESAARVVSVPLHRDAVGRLVVGRTKVVSVSDVLRQHGGQKMLWPGDGRVAENRRRVGDRDRRERRFVPKQFFPGRHAPAMQQESVAMAFMGGSVLGGHPEQTFLPLFESDAIVSDYMTKKRFEAMLQSMWPADAAPADELNRYLLFQSAVRTVVKEMGTAHEGKSGKQKHRKKRLRTEDSTLASRLHGMCWKELELLTGLRTGYEDLGAAEAELNAELENSRRDFDEENNERELKRSKMDESDSSSDSDDEMASISPMLRFREGDIVSKETNNLVGDTLNSDVDVDGNSFLASISKPDKISRSEQEPLAGNSSSLRFSDEDELSLSSGSEESPEEIEPNVSEHVEPTILLDSDVEEIQLARKLDLDSESSVSSLSSSLSMSGNLHEKPETINVDENSESSESDDRSSPLPPSFSWGAKSEEPNATNAGSVVEEPEMAETQMIVDQTLSEILDDSSSAIEIESDSD